MKLKRIKFHTIFLFLLPLCLVFLGAGCDDEGLSLKHSINGSWKVSKQVISVELEGVVAPPENALYFDISIVIPNTTSGVITGHTFYNTFGVQFEIMEERKVSLKNFLATRIAEDDWGRLFQENLLNTVKFSLSNDELLFIDSRNQTVIVFLKN